MSRKTNRSKFHRVLSITGLTVLFIAVAAVFLHFSWNMAMPDLFGAEEMSFKNALGLVFLLSAAAALIGRSAAGRPKWRRHAVVVESEQK